MGSVEDSQQGGSAPFQAFSIQLPYASSVSHTFVLVDIGDAVNTSVTRTMAKGAPVHTETKDEEDYDILTLYGGIHYASH
jgi:hypothetical protein